VAVTGIMNDCGASLGEFATEPDAVRGFKVIAETKRCIGADERYDFG